MALDKVASIYSEYSNVLQSKDHAGRLLFLIYFTSRLGKHCEVNEIVSHDDSLHALEMLTAQYIEPNEQRAELMAIYFGDEATKLSDGNENFVCVSFWSSLCYYFMYSKNKDKEYLAYSLDVFLSAIEDYFFNKDARYAQAEIENLATAKEVISKVVPTGLIDDVHKIILLASSSQLGERLAS